jgi:MFS family permease
MCVAARAAAPPAFPWPTVLLLMVINISEPIAITILFPFAPVMVGAWVAEDEVGVWAGLLASVYNFTGFLANPLVGRAVDRVGALTVLAPVLVGAGGSLVLFGCSTSLRLAFASRALGGLFSGVSTCARAASSAM